MESPGEDDLTHALDHRACVENICAATHIYTEVLHIDVTMTKLVKQV